MDHNYLIAEAAHLFKILGKSLRIHILIYLRQNGESAVGDLVTHLKASQPVVSKQLGILSKAEFVQKRRDGNFIYYSINDPDIIEIIDAMTEHIEHIKKQ